MNEQLTQVPETIKHRTLAVSTLNYIISRNVQNFTPKKKNIIFKEIFFVKENGESFESLRNIPFSRRTLQD